MALVKCPDCGKSISDKAVSCNACGYPLGGGGSVGNAAFEQRIEQYKANGYNLIKRSGDSVEMRKVNNVGKFFIKWILGFAIFFGAVIILGNLFIDEYVDFLYNGGKITITLISIFLFVFPWVRLLNTSKVIITLTKIGKLEESGNVLKKK